MNNSFETVGAFERGWSNRAILLVVAMALAGIVLDEVVHATSMPTRPLPAASVSTPRPADSPCA